ncbi:dTDP-4-dehydrorhamnose reductase [Rhodovulum imhoffii]|uniref:dTDP-4-dehydrorhamnose reductase n=1 Tax=Rhodovulum imhoffii TaxID=365340 RepID=A0A2T5BPS8_9RHOB|nr:dTDP-4-dehydrorhamnose reductase [Rhodovulum imhoffii]MBK5933595.1 dTDP-4-dehydrorhamnose reductase [Rhodovulum imhoffii]PTN01034.1 dTDP-4-dehydrorhamnose reductase [Rhodovulum imhoffii]
MTVLVFGQTGQVATELARIAPQARFLSRADADLTDPAACAAQVAESGAQAVINAAAYTAVDKAENDETIAMAVNAHAPGAMARACAQRGIPFVHISTDYVFDGSGTRPWHPGDPTAPLGVYGRSKLAGEETIRAANGPHVILRTSWVVSAHGANFVKTMLRLSETRDALTVVADQVGGPTPAAAIAQAVWAVSGRLCTDGPSGTYHFSGAPDVSWADFAREIFAQAGRRVRVTDISTREYPTPARRPANSRLDCTGLEHDYAIARPDWRAGLADILKELGIK